MHEEKSVRQIFPVLNIQNDQKFSTLWIVCNSPTLWESNFFFNAMNDMSPFWKNGKYANTKNGKYANTCQKFENIWENQLKSED